MEEDRENPSEIKSFLVNEALNASMVDFNKKRKLQAEQLGLPTAKHKCLDCHLNSEPLSTKVENFQICLIQDCPGRGTIDDESEAESAKDSNSFAGDSDSVSSEAKLDIEDSKMWPYDRHRPPSNSAFNFGSHGLNDAHSSVVHTTVVERGAGKEELTLVGGEHDAMYLDNSLNVSDDLDEPILNHVDYFGLGYGNDTIEPYTDKELGELLCSNEANPNTYVLSSGRWSINKESHQSTKKPTIDQEFEQYFSMLML